MKKHVGFIQVTSFVLALLFAISFSNAEESITLGTVNGSVYENEYLGIGCRLDGWYIYNIEDLANHNSLTTGVSLSAEELSSDLHSKIMEYGTITLFGAIVPGSSATISITITYNEGIEASANAYGMENFVSMLKDRISSSYQEMLGQDATIDTVSVQIGNKTFYGVDIITTNAGQQSFMRQLHSAKEDFNIVITLAGDSIEQLNTISSLFYLLHTETALAFPRENVNKGPEYYDEELGIHIAIPDGWEQLNLSKERQMLRMKMGRIDEPNCIIMYAVNDLWESLTDVQKTALGATIRSDLDSFALDVSIMASLLGKDKSEVELRKYAGKSYTIASINQDTPFGGTVDVLTASTIKNGYLVIYQLYDLSSNYPDSFDSVLEGVYYD